MQRRLLALAAAAFMAMPGTAMAADPTPVEAPGSGSTVTGYYYYLAGVELGGETFKFEGKLWIEGDQLGASVGCNSIGARVAFDGASLDILDGIVTTEIGCPNELAQAEALLIRALASGPLRWDGSGFIGNGARILASDFSTRPVTPPDQIIVPPDTPITSEPDPMPGIDVEVCREFLTPDEWSAIFGEPGAVSGSGGGAVDGQGSSGTPSGSTGGETDPVQGVPGSEPSPPAPADPSPGEVLEPGAVGVPVPPPVDPAPAPDGGPLPDPGTVTSDLVDGTTSIGRDDVPVAQSKDAPAPTPSAELCRELLARTSSIGTPKAAPGPDQAPLPGEGAGADTETARDDASFASIRPELAFALVLLGGLLFIAWLRTTGGQARRA